MAIWSSDLTTEDGALGATQMGAYCCFAAAGLTVIGLVMMLAVTGAGAGYALIFAIVQVGIFGAAGIRFNEGNGVLWGSAAALLLALEIVAKLVMLSLSVWLILNIIMLIGAVNGVRGAQALHKGIVNDDEAAEIFR